MRKSLFAALLLPLLIFSLFSCKKEVKLTFAELTLTLPLGFSEGVSATSADVFYTNGEVGCAVLRIPFAAENVPANLPTDEFARFYMEKTETEANLYSYKDIPYYTYETYTAYCMQTFYRTPYAYFSVLYTAPIEAKLEWHAEFLNIADTALLVWD